MPITAALVKQLRERTGAGMMDCKRALTEVDGDLDRAAEFLRKAGQAKADRKAARVAQQGVVLMREDAGGNRCAVLEINCETDFVAKDENFVNFAESLVEVVLNRTPADVEELLAMEIDGESVETLRRELIAKVGENISVRRFEVFSSNDVMAPIPSGRIGSLVEMQAAPVDLAGPGNAVAAMSPRPCRCGRLRNSELEAGDSCRVRPRRRQAATFVAKMGGSAAQTSLMREP